MEDDTNTWEGFWDSVSDGFSGLFNNLTTSISTWFQESLNFLEEKFSELITNIETLLKDLFVPNKNYFDNKIDEIKTSFESKFPIVEQLLNLFNDFVNSTTVSTSTMPIFEFTIYGTTVALLDFSLLEDYLPIVRNIISIFLWVQFLLSLLFKLPNIIQGQTFFEVRSAELDWNYSYLQKRSKGRFTRL